MKNWFMKTFFGSENPSKKDVRCCCAVYSIVAAYYIFCVALIKWADKKTNEIEEIMKEEN